MRRSHSQVASVLLVAAFLTACSAQVEVERGGGPIAEGVCTPAEVSPPPDRPHHPPALGPITEVASGTFDCQPWVLIAYDSKDAPCSDLELGSAISGHCAGGTIEGINAASQAWSHDLPDWIQVHGEVAKDIVELEARYEGEKHDVELHQVARLDRTFFVVFFPTGSGGELMGRDEKGDVIDRVEVRPQPPSFLDE